MAPIRDVHRALARAIEIAAHVHSGQVDKGGEPYILHCLTVMDWAREEARLLRFAPEGFVNEVAIIAVLHDTIEDYQGGAGERGEFRMMIQSTFGDVVYDALDCLTKRVNEAYEAYIERVSANLRARFVKPRDLRHNMDPRRMPARTIEASDYERWDRYRKALVRLEQGD